MTGVPEDVESAIRPSRWTYYCQIQHSSDETSEYLAVSFSKPYAEPCVMFRLSTSAFEFSLPMCLPGRRNCLIPCQQRRASMRGISVPVRTTLTGVTAQTNHTYPSTPIMKICPISLFVMNVVHDHLPRLLLENEREK